MSSGKTKCPICQGQYVRLSSHLSKSSCGFLLSSMPNQIQEEEEEEEVIPDALDFDDEAGSEVPRSIHIGTAGGRGAEEEGGGQPEGGAPSASATTNIRRSTRKRRGSKTVDPRTPVPRRRVVGRSGNISALTGPQEAPQYDSDLEDYLATAFYHDRTQGNQEEIVGGEVETIEQDMTSVGAVGPPPLSVATTSGTGNEDIGGVNNEPTESMLLGRPRHLTQESQQPNLKIEASQIAMARLYSLCDRVGSPRYLGDRIIDLLNEERRQNGFSISDPRIRRRDALMTRLQKATKIPFPEQIPLTLESGRQVHVYRFPFPESLQRHLLSSAFADEANLHVRGSNPWESACDYPSSLREFHDGKWYKDTIHRYQSELDNPQHYMIHPLLFYIDKTGTDKVEKNSLEPLMATSTILKSTAREKSGNWFPIGLIPSSNTKSSADKKLEKGRQAKKGMSTREYHQCLEILLEPLKKIQRERPVMTFRRGDSVCTYRIVCPLAGIICDNLAADLLCGRTGNRHLTAARLSRRCMTSAEQADMIGHTCYAVPEPAIHRLACGAMGCEFGHHVHQPLASPQLSETQRIPSTSQSLNFEHWRRHLRTLPQGAQRVHTSFMRRRQIVCHSVLSKVFCAHPVYNAFQGVDFGTVGRGICQGTLSDIMHTVEEGVIPKLLETFFMVMTPQQLSRIDSLVEDLFNGKVNRSGERTNYPRVSFTRGYTKLTLLSADERVGQLFVLSLLLQTEIGRDMLQERFNPEFDEKRVKAAARFRGKTDGSGTEEGDEESDQPSDDEASEEDTQSQQTRVPQLDDQQIERILQAMDLGYIWDNILPTLPPGHARILKGTLRSTIKPTWIKNVGMLDIPPGHLDYQKRVEDTHKLSAEQGPVDPPLESSFQGKVLIQEGREKCSIRLTMKQFTFLCEMILTYHSLLKYGHPDIGLEQVQRQYNESICLMKELLTVGIDRGKGTHGWKIQKFLEMDHFLEDTINFGTPGGFSTSTGERGLKAWAKHPAKTAQRRSDSIFSGQVCLRMHEASIMEATLASSSIHEGEDVDDGNSCTESNQVLLQVYGTNFWYQREEGNSQGHVWKLDKNRKRSRVVEYPEVILAWFDSNIETDDAVQGINIFTELRMKTGGGNSEPASQLIVRAHHNYQGHGPWHDFALVHYNLGEQEEAQNFPCKVVCFFRAPQDGGDRALVQECTTYQAIDDTSLLSSGWQLMSERLGDFKKPIFRDVSIDTISDRIYCIEDNPKGLTYRNERENFSFLLIRYCRQEWPDKFLEANSHYSNT